jgi:hypothetical protein
MADTEDVAGFETNLYETVIVSPVASVAPAVLNVKVTGTVTAEPTRAGDAVPCEKVPAPVCAAEAGATEVKTPKPKAATATSATRLKVVFVDICFLSISRSREFPPVGFG